MNWGHKLLITFIVFAGMMSYLVFRAYQTNFELVKTDYYKDELAYQQVIDGKSRANALSSLPVVKQDSSNIILQMPEEMKGKVINGSVWFYCAYNSANDKKLKLAIDANGEQILSGLLHAGNYTVKIDWNAEGKNYYAEKNMIVF